MKKVLLSFFIFMILELLAIILLRVISEILVLCGFPQIMLIVFLLGLPTCFIIAIPLAAWLADRMLT